MDIVDKTTRSRMMSGIKGKNTRPEMMIRQALFAEGFRYRLHVKTLAGKPDLVFPKFKKVIFVHGCFWHRHDCHLFKWPSTRIEFWKHKINKNVCVDSKNIQSLKDDGWTILTVWECSMKGKHKLNFNELIKMISDWLLTSNIDLVISGKEKD
ncbi:MAG: very short patch repair endonuclease [Gammaproteobacteria bacterium]|nr:very short patch repair endonuclease [Gammaproteobacteria bacterium]